LSVSDDAQKELGKLKAGSLDLVVLAIDMKTEVLQSTASTGKINLEDIIKGGHLPEKEPRYFIYRFNHSFEEKQQSSIVFLYYCPDIATPRNKMTYSAMKQNVGRIAENLGITLTKTVEFTEPGELNAASLLQELYPKSSEKKVISKPRKPGKGATGLIGGAKFSSK